MLQNMGELTAVDKVLALEELLVPILAYSSTGHNRNNVLKLRSVCSKWRSLCLPLLNSHGYLANVNLADADDFTKLVDSLTPSCLLPINLNITKSELTLEEMKIVWSYAFNFVTVKIVDVNVTGTVTDKLDCDLPLLKNLEVSIPSYANHSDSSPLHELIEALVLNGNHLEEFNLRFFLNRGDYMSGQLLTKVTKLFTSFTDFPGLERTFLQNNLPKLTYLHLMTGVEWDEETDVITRIVNNFSGQLKVFKYSCRESVYGCKLGKMEFLEELDTYGIKVNSFDESRPFSELVPNLKSMKIAAMPIHYPVLFCRNRCRYENLVKLNITGFSDQGQDDIAHQLRQIDNCIPSVKEFSLPWMPRTLATEALPVVFTRMQRLTKLHIGMACPWVDLVHLLTGIETSELPEDPELWQGILTGREECITNLTNLNEFSFEVELSDNYEPILEIHPFLFQAAFNEMSNLRKLTLKNILVKEDLIENWRAIGRQLVIFPIYPMEDPEDY